MNKIIENDGTEYSETREILKCQQNFYENLNSDISNDVDGNPIEDIVGENENKLSNDESQKLEGDIKLFILRALNYGYRTGSLSVTQKQGIITCLPKPGKSRHYLKNWRPISLLNIVYKLAPSVIAIRLKTTLDKLINQDQKGFISGRFIGENVRLMYDILFATRNDNIPGTILSIDFEKAFNTVSWKFIKNVLKYFNSGPSFISWINIFQTDFESCIIQNGFMSDFLTLKGDVGKVTQFHHIRIFILCAEILGKMIREKEILTTININGKEFRLSQYGDDTESFLDGTEQSLKETLNILNKFYSMSGLKINVEKTRAIWIGSLSHSNRQLCREFKLDWSQGAFKI